MTNEYRPPDGGHLGLRSVMWALVPLLSLGLLTPFVFVYAAVRLRGRWMRLATAAYALACAAWTVGVSMPERSAGPGVAAVLMFALMTVGTTHAFVIRRRVFTAPTPQPALSAALAARQRRAEARLIATRDAALANDLCIGRPDIPHMFDDGGLVDVNHVPSPVLVDRLGLSADQATSLVSARTGLGGFSSTDELVLYTELTPPMIERIHDHLVFLA